MSRVAVRIVRRGRKYLVIGRVTTLEFDDFEAAWAASVEFFAGRRR